MYLSANKVLDAAYGVGTQKREMAGIILDVFLVGGFPAGVALAAIINAEAESGLNPNAVGDNGHSVGLFQLNDIGGKLTFDFDRKDPYANAKAILREFERLYAKKGKIGNYTTPISLHDMIKGNTSVGAFAGRFAAIVERPADIPGEMAKREQLAFTRFGTDAKRSVNDFLYDSNAVARTAANPELASTLARRYWWLASLAMVGTAGMLWWTTRPRR